MAKAVVPILWVKYRRCFSLDAIDVLDGHTCEDEFTYTTRVSLMGEGDPEVEIERARLRAKLRERLAPNEASELIKLLDENEWDVSFFVDAY